MGKECQVLGGLILFAGRKPAPPTICAQRLFPRAWTMDEEMMKIYLESQMGGGIQPLT